MIKTVDYDIVGSYNNQRIKNIDAERSVNMFQYVDPLGKKEKTLINTSGLINTDKLFPDTDLGFRAQFVFNSNEYDVIGSSIYQINLSGAVSLIGTLENTSTGYVGVDANTFQIIFVDGVNGYIWDTTANTFTMITDTSFPAQPVDVCYLDGYFVVANGGTKNFQLSGFEQGLVWGVAENFYTASAATDLFTITGGTSNYQTGIQVQLVPPTTGVNFTTDFGTDNTAFNITSPGTTTNYQTGVGVKVSNSGGSLPTCTPALTAGVEYYVINTGPSTIQLTTTYADAIGNTGQLVISNDGSGTNTMIGQLPDGFDSVTTYYTIRIDSTTIKLASSYTNAIAGTAIDVESNAGADNQILGLGQLQQGSITTHPGNIIACRTLHRRLFLFSLFFTEVWENAGAGTNLPFRRNNSLLMEYGTQSPGNISVGFDVMMFLSQTRDGIGSVMLVSGTESRPASTRALDFQLAQYAAANQISDCRGFLIKENGLIFYRMNFTEANHTFVFNVTLSSLESDATKLWHEEEVLNGDRHPAQTHAYFNGINYVGDYQSPIRYQIDSNTFTNAGEKIRRMRITKSLVPPGYQRIRIDRLQIDLLQGTSFQMNNQTVTFNLITQLGQNISTQNGFDLILQQTTEISDPLFPDVFLSISKNGGQTYGYQARAPMGKVGETRFRTLWRKLGVIPRGQGFVAKFEFFEPVPFVILGASWAMEVLPE